MAQRRLVPAEAERAIARKPFQFREGDGVRLPVEEMSRGVVVAGPELSLAHHVAGEVGAPVGPGRRTAQRLGGGRAFGQKFSGAVPESQTGCAR